jgi:hypothetical protein
MGLFRYNPEVIVSYYDICNIFIAGNIQLIPFLTMYDTPDYKLLMSTGHFLMLFKIFHELLY